MLNKFETFYYSCGKANKHFTNMFFSKATFEE